MRIADLTKKPLWYRRALTTFGGRSIKSWSSPASASSELGRSREEPMEMDRSNFISMKQSDFLNEYYPSSHNIFDTIYRSDRPLYKWDEKLKKNVFDGYDPIFRTSLSLQKVITETKATQLFGNEIRFYDELGQSTDSNDILSKIKGYWNISNFRAALMEFATELGATGDAAMYIYLDSNKRIRYKIFSFRKGDNVTERDVDGERVGVRYFNFEGLTAVELYKTKHVELWVKLTNEKIEEVKAYYPSWNFETVSDDGYYLVESNPNGLSQNSFIYYREDDVWWGDVQKNIEDLEELLSNAFDNGKTFFFPILFLAGGVISLPEINDTNKAIGSRTKDGKAEFLSPPDVSNLFTVAWDKSWKAILDGAHYVSIRPDELKGQNDSSAYLELLYTPATAWATLVYARMHTFFMSLIDIVKECVGVIENDIQRYKTFELSYDFVPYIPKNLNSDIQMINASYQSGTLSRETAIESHPMSNPLELSRVEVDDERKRQEEIKKEVIDVENNNQPPQNLNTLNPPSQNDNTE